MFARQSHSTPDARFLVEDYKPAYLALYRSGELQQRVDQALEELRDCCACPRNCHVDRLEGEARVCHTGRYARVASVFPHFGEEDCLRGWRGSGTIFFAACNLRCVFCQNWDISQSSTGEECTAERLADHMLTLQEHGCHNINFVTPEHVAPQVIEAIAAAVPRGLRLPIVYNTSAYDALTSLSLLDGLIDIYMPDFKFWHRKDYPEHARAAVAEMHRQVGPLRFGADGLARRGLLVRHLVMPGQEDEAKAIFAWLAQALSPDTYLNIMAQYRPQFQVGVSDLKNKYRDIDRRPRRQELSAACAAARAAGLWRFDQRS
jgi:putative pyruvate formate lyase activating enzyme